MSGVSTPLSSTTISTPSSLKSTTADLDEENVFQNPRIQASHIIELISSRATSSSTVYVYDVAEQAGFGTLTKLWSKSKVDTASVVDLQTRAGAGLSLVGRLSEGTSQDTSRGAVLTAYTTPSGLSVMAQSLSYLPLATPTSRLVIQVPAVVPVGDKFALSPSLASLSTAMAILPENIVVLLSATPQESVDLTTLSYKLNHSHVVHIFDHHSSSREIGHSIAPIQLSSKGSLASENLADAGYKPFDYTGDVNAEGIIVMLNGPLALTASAFASRTAGFGVVSVRMLRPWDETAFRSILPTNVKHVHVLDEVPNAAAQGILYVEVFSSLLGTSSTTIHTQRIVPSQTQRYMSEPASFTRYLTSLVQSATPSKPLDYPDSKKLLFFTTPKSSLSSLPHVIEDTFLSNEDISARLLTDHDVFSRQGGITANRILISQKGYMKDHIPIPAVLPFTASSQGSADFLGILDHNILKTHSISKYAKPDSVLLIVTPWSSVEFSSNVAPDILSVMLKKNLNICIIDAKTLASSLAGAAGPAQDITQVVIVHLAFLRLYLGNAATEERILKVARVTYQGRLSDTELVKINALAWSGLVKLDIPPEIAAPAADIQPSAPLKEFEFNAIAVEAEDGDDVVNGAKLGSWHDAAKHLLFPSVFTPNAPPNTHSEKYPQNPALRPEVPDRTFLVTTTVNRRLTPLEYNRNVFHLEFDTSDTGLKYAIGEALGVHGWNDEQDVLDFCKWYGVDPGRLVTIPVTAGEGRLHTRTVLQALQQQIDLFGRPPRSFYTDLAPYATKPSEKYSLEFIGSAEGSSTFKKMAEKDTVTFADVLMQYASAKPGIEKLCEMIGDIKPRHYSIASAQSVVGDRVDLLVVTIDWVTPSGSLRYGQCTRYLAGLRVGQKVTVSIKPSVMKLPPDTKQPLIMAGLGTGAAPFRAFLQHRALIAQQGVQVGPVYYYFGSRHQSQEYLYGEEIEAFIQDGTITRAGLAFSRDGPKKVYIQHKMLEDAETLVQMLHDGNGVFYLCGPTWPVPDVYEALVGALVKYKGKDPVSAGAYLEGLKEEERYVLEVY